MTRNQRSHMGDVAKRAGRRFGVAALLAAVAVAGVPVGAEAAQTGTVFPFVSTIGGPGRAELYPSGVEAASNGAVVVADTGNDRVVKYDAAGAVVWSHGIHGLGTTGLSNPRDVAVDSTGSVYIADEGNSRIVKLNANGNYVRTWNGPTGDKLASPIGITVANGEVIVSDAAVNKIRFYSLSGTQLRTISATTCPFSRPRDVTADAAGNLYVANYTANNILKLAPDGTCLLSWGTAGSGNGQFANPYGVAVGTDPTLGETVYVADSNNERIQVFSTSGAFVTAFGSAGGFGTPGTFDSLRRVAVAADGDVWGADLWGNTVQRWNRTAGGWTHAQVVGSTEAPATSTAIFNSVGGLAFGSNGDLYATDTVNQRIAHFDTAGNLVSVCGDRGFGLGTFNWPRGVAIDHTTGDIWVADTRQSRIQVLTNGCTPLAGLGSVGSGANQLDWPSSIATDQAARLAFVTDSHNNRISIWNMASRTNVGTFGGTGTGLGQFADPRGIAIQPGTGDVFVADRQNDRIVKMTRVGSTLTAVAAFTDGFDRPEGVAVDEQGRIFVADTRKDRVVVLDSTGAEIATFDDPTGLFDPNSAAIGPDGSVYVSDTQNHRVQKYSGSPPVDTEAPVATFTQPADDSVGNAPVMLAGAATDNVGVTGVQVAVRDRTTNTWWRPSTQTWGAVEWFAANLDVPGATSTDWSVNFAPVAGSDLYAAKARAVDEQGNTSAEATTSFTAYAIPPDTVAPDTVLTVPTVNQVYSARPAAFSGTATDNVGVAAVQVAVKDQANNLWWNPATSTWGAIVRTDATLGSPNGANTTWTYSFDDTANKGSGSYLVQARAKDTSNKVDATVSSARFSIAAVTDTVAPDTVISVPTTDQIYNARPAVFSGTASDNVAVAAVQISVKDRANNLWWNPVTSSWGAIVRTDATLGSPNAANTTWTHAFDDTANPGSGQYLVQARAKDTSNKVDATVPSKKFSIIVTPPDTAAPDTTLTQPLDGEAFPLRTITATGGATDDTGVTSVQVSVKDRTTNKWWNPAGNTWGTTEVRYDGTVVTPGGTSVTWSAAFDAAAAKTAGGSGQYLVEARAGDGAAKVDASPPSAMFSVGNVADTLAPNSAITFPAKSSSHPAGIVTVTGTATDDWGVASLDVAVRDRATNLWWNPTTQTWGTLRRIPATLAHPGSTATTWSFDVDSNVLGGSGDYWVQSRAVDTSGNADATVASTYFLVNVSGALPPQYVGTLAGPGLADITPVDVAATATHYYVLDVGRYRIVRVNRTTGLIDAEVGGIKSSAPDKLAAARALALDSAGNVWVADTPNNAIKKFDANLNFVGAYGSKGTVLGKFTQVYGVAVGTGKLANGSLGEVVYSIDGDGRIQKWTTNGAVIGQFATGLPLDQPRMAEVHPVTHDLWLVNARDRQIVVVDVDGVEQLRFGQGGTAPGRFMGDPRGIAINPAGDRVFVSDEGNHRVQVFNTAGVYQGQLGAASPGPGYLADARGLVVTPDNVVVVSDEWDFSMKTFQPTGPFVAKLFGNGPPVGGVNSPRGLAVDSLGRIFVSDWWNNRIQRFNANGTSPLAFGFRGTTLEPGSINFAWGLAIQPGTDRLFVANRESHEIEVFTADGAYVTRWGIRGPADGQFVFPHGVAFVPDGSLLVTDSDNNRIQRFSIDAAGNGTFVAKYGTAGTAAGNFAVPTGIDVAADGTIWVADTENDRIQKRDPNTGTWTAFSSPVGGSQFKRPWGIRVAPNGAIWITDSGNDRIVRIDAAGNQQMTATGTDMGSGPLVQPHDLEFGSNGHLYVSDIWNNRVIELAP